MPLLPVPTKQKETPRPAKRAREGRAREVTAPVLKMREVIRASAWCWPRKEEEEWVDLTRARGRQAVGGRRRGAGQNRVFVSIWQQATVCRRVRGCSAQRNAQTRAPARGRRLIYGCGYFTTRATRIPFGGANEKP